MSLHIVTNHESPFLTCEEVARRWKCSKSTIYRRINAGLLETVGQGALLRITLASVLGYEDAMKNCRRRAS